MTEEQRRALEKLARSTSLPHRKVTQAKALLLAADGVATNEVARRCRTTNDSVRAWRRRFEAEGVEGVGRIAPGRGRRAWLPEGTVAAVLHDTLHAAPEDGSIDPIASCTADRGRRLERLQGFRWQSGLIPGRLPLAAGSGICIGRGRRCCDPSLSR
jgi:hypothetical protein